MPRFRHSSPKMVPTPEKYHPTSHGPLLFRLTFGLFLIIVLAITNEKNIVMIIVLTPFHREWIIW
jgi:hypothetical protein